MKRLDGFRPTLEPYHARMSELGRQVIGLLELGLDSPPGELGRAFTTPTTWLRLLHYPPVDTSAPDDLFGSAPHRDFGALTFLAQDDVGGLEVRTPEGAWVAAPPMPRISPTRCR